VWPGRLVGERDAGEPPGRIQADRELLAIALHYPGDRTAFDPDLAIDWTIGTTQIGAIETETVDPLQEVGRIAVGRETGTGFQPRRS
jgi:hypothetical protein